MKTFSSSATASMIGETWTSDKSNSTAAINTWTPTAGELSTPTVSTMNPGTDQLSTERNQTWTTRNGTWMDTNTNKSTSWTSTVDTWTSDLLNLSSTETNWNRMEENWTSETAPDWTSPEANWSVVQNSTDGSWFSDNENQTSIDWLLDGMGDNSTEGMWEMVTTVVAEVHTVPLYILYLYFSLRVLWALFTIIGNTMTIFIIAKFEAFHTSSNYLICSLAVADLSSVAAVPLTILHRTYANSAYFIPFCLSEQTINMLSLAGSLVHIMYISIDRYIYIAKPYRYPMLITTPRTLTIIFLTWIIYTVSVTLTMYFANRLTLGMTCKFSVFILPSVYRFFMTPQFLIFLSVTIGFNIAIAKIAFKQSRAIAAAQQAPNSVEALVSQRTRKISGMLATLLGAYLLCIIPQYVMALVLHRRVTTTLLSMELMTTLMYWGSNWVNPILYVWRLKQFRVALKRVFTGQGNLHDYADVF